MEHKDKIDVSDRIIEVGTWLFRQYGMRTITMDEIARQTGISKKTIYAHFVDKDELVDMVVQRFVNTTQQNCLAMQQEAGDAVEEIFLLIQYLDGLFRNMNPVVLAEMQKYHVKAHECFKAHQNGFVKQMIRKNLEWGIKDELYRPEVNIEVITRFRMEIPMICMKQDVYPRDKFPMYIVQRELMVHYLYGIASSKGNKLISKYKEKYFADI